MSQLKKNRNEIIKYYSTNDVKLLAILKKLLKLNRFHDIKSLIEDLNKNHVSHIIEQYYLISLCHLGESGKAHHYFKQKYSDKSPVSLIELYTTILFLEGDLNAIKNILDEYVTVLSPNQISQLNLSLQLLSLRAGDLDGFRSYVSNIKLPKIVDQYVSKNNLKFWQGEDLKDKKILIIFDQGIGDVLFYSRYIAYFNKICEACYFLPSQELHSLFQFVFSKKKGAHSDKKPPDFDKKLLLLDKKSPEIDYVLPLKLILNAIELPLEEIVYPPLDFSTVPSMQITDRFSERKLKVGLCWTGSKDFFWDSLRSIPFEQFNKLCAIEGVRYYALQKNVDEVALSYFKIDPCRKNMSSLVQLAAMIKSVDLVITVDSMIAHLAGSLGVKTWVLSRFSSDWRWTIDDVTSRWYKSVTLFQQDKNQKYEWDPVLEKVKQALIKEVSYLKDIKKENHDQNMMDAVKNQNWKEVIYQAHFLLEKNENLSKSYFEMGKAYKFLYKQTLARQHLERALEGVKNESFLINIKYHLIDIYINLGDYEQAGLCLEACDQKVVNKDYLYRSYARYYVALGEYSKGDAFFRKRLKQESKNPNLYYALGYLNYEQLKFDKAKQYYQQAILLAPKDIFFKWTQHTVLFLNNDWEEAIESYENRFEILKGLLPGWVKNYKKWAGESLKDKVIALVSEQGLGDIIFFSRLIECYERLGVKKIYFYVREELKALFQKNILRNYEVVSSEKERQHIDYYFPILSTMHQLQLSQTSLQAQKCQIVLRDHVPIQTTEDKLKVGLVWEGNQDFIKNNLRSFPLEQYGEVIKKNACHYFSLQQNTDLMALDYYGIIDLRKDFQSIDQLAAIIKGLDLVITVDTMIAHLSAALGVPTFMIVGGLPDWRWGIEGDKTPYYPTMTLFRREIGDKDWSAVIQKINFRLKKLVSEKKNNKILQLLENAKNNFSKGDFKEAEKDCLEINKKEPKNFEAIQLLIQSAFEQQTLKYLKYNEQIYDKVPEYFHCLKESRKPFWSGRAYENKRLLVCGDRSLEIQFVLARLIPMLRRKIKQIIFYVSDELYPILSALSEYATIVKQSEPMPEHDLFIPQLLLVERFKLKTRDDFKKIQPYYFRLPILSQVKKECINIGLYYQSESKLKAKIKALSNNKNIQIYNFSIIQVKESSTLMNVKTKPLVFSAQMDYFFGEAHLLLYIASNQGVKIQLDQDESKSFLTNFYPFILKDLKLKKPEHTSLLAAQYCKQKAFYKARVFYEKALLDNHEITHEHYYAFIRSIYNLGHYKEAMFHIKQLVGHKSSDMNLLNMLAFCHEYLGASEEALAVLEKNCEAHQNDWKTVEFYMNMLRKRLQYSKVETMLNDFYKRTKSANALFETVINDYHLGKIKTGIKAANQLLELQPKGQVYVNRALLKLKNFDFENAQSDYAYRKDFFTMFEHPWQFEKPKWEGQTLPEDKTLLLVGEQGLGDRFQMLRFVKHLKKRAPKIRLLLSSVFFEMRTCFDFGDITVLKASKILPDYDYYLPVMDLMFMMDLDKTSLKKYEPLKISPPKINLQKSGKIKVGINFLGNHLFLGDNRRSVNIEDFKGIFDFDNIQFYNLCNEFHPEDIAGSDVIDLRKKYQSLEELASVLKELDLVITVDSMIAHLAGSLGIQCWSLIPYASDWRWGVKGDKTGWYPSLTLYRQKEEGHSWHKVAVEIIADLKKKYN